MLDLTIEYECAFEKFVPEIRTRIVGTELNALLACIKGTLQWAALV